MHTYRLAIVFGLDVSYAFLIVAGEASKYRSDPISYLFFMSGLAGDTR